MKLKYITLVLRFKLQTTFWAKPAAPDAKAKPLEIDFDKLEEKFFEEKKKEDPTKAVNTKTKEPQFTIIDPMKLNNVNIVLTSFTQPLNDLVEILIACKDELTIEQLSKMISLIPADEERKKLVEYKGELSKLMDVEKFLKKLVAIPRLKQRVECQIFKKNYDTELHDFEVKSEQLHEPFLVLKSCPKFQNVLKFILEIFNYLNHGTPKANQASLTIDALNSLESLKSFDKKTSMMGFIVESIRVKTRHILFLSLLYA